MPADGSAPPQNITVANKACDAGPVVSPDGTRLAYRAMKRPGFEADRFGVMIMDMASGATREIDPSWDRSAESLKWSPDGRTLYLTAADTQTERLYAMDAASGRVAPLTTGGHVTEYDLAGPDLVFLRDSMAGPAQLYRTSAHRGTEAVQLSRFDADKLAGVDLAPYESFTFTGWNGEEVHGWVVKPVGWQARTASTPPPSLIHGGPQGSVGRQLELPLEPAVLRGAGLRGGDGRFPRLHRLRPGLHRRDQRPLGRPPAGGPAEGLGRRRRPSYPWVDGSRACALGASYGGFMTYWIAGVWNAPWKCLVDHDGVFDDRMMGYSTEELWFSTWEHGGPRRTSPGEDPAAYERFNPIDQGQGLVQADPGDPRRPRLPHPAGAGAGRLHRGADQGDPKRSSSPSPTRTTGC